YHAYRHHHRLPTRRSSDLKAAPAAPGRRRWRPLPARPRRWPGRCCVRPAPAGSPAGRRRPGAAARRRRTGATRWPPPAAVGWPGVPPAARSPGAWAATRAAAGTAWDRTRGTAATAAYRSRRTTGQGADRSWVPGSGGKQARDFLGARAQERFVAARLHVQAQQGLGVGTAQVEAPVAEVGADAIGVVQRRRLRGEVVHHPRHGGLGVGDAEVDLAAARELAHAGLDQVAQAAAAGGDQAGDQQPGDHARVGIGELAEIVVRAHLAAIHAVLGAHLLLDEGVAALAPHRYAAGFLHLLDGVPD